MKYIPMSVSRRVGRLILQTQKHSPTLLFGAGVVGVVATTVLASKATLNLEEVLAQTNKDFDAARGLHESGNVMYTDQMFMQDRVRIWTRGVMAVSKLYAPAIVVGSLSIGALTGSHYIMRRRNTGLMVAYAALDKAHNEYRQRVINDVGSDKELEYRYQTEQKPDGKKDEKQPSVAAGASMYARFFDEYSTNWERNPELNHIFLRCIQNRANDMLRSRGHIFLNEVYDLLGIDRTEAGSVVGWLCGTESDGQCYVDFGLYDDRPSSRNFINGRSDAILLDFNVDGIIYHKLGK